MRTCTFHNNVKEKRVKYCVYKRFYNKYELIAMTIDLSRVESLIGFKFKEKLDDVISNVGDCYIEDDYMIKAENFIY